MAVDLGRLIASPDFLITSALSIGAQPLFFKISLCVLWCVWGGERDEGKGREEEREGWEGEKKRGKDRGREEGREREGRGGRRVEGGGYILICWCVCSSACEHTSTFPMCMCGYFGHLCLNHSPHLFFGMRALTTSETHSFGWIFWEMNSRNQWDSIATPSAGVTEG